MENKCQKGLITKIIVFIPFVMCMILFSCKENTKYHPIKGGYYEKEGLLGKQPDSLSQSDILLLKDYLDATNVAKVKCERTGATFYLSDTLLVNIETGKTMREDQAIVDHRTLSDMTKIDGVERGESKRYFFISIYAICALVIVGVVVMFVLGDGTETYNKHRNCTIALSIPSLVANLSYAYYGLTFNGRAYWFLFSPSEHGWMLMIADWLAFFLITAINCAGYFLIIRMFSVTISIKNNNIMPNFLMSYAGLAVIIWMIVYYFSSTAFNGYFILAFFAILLVHLICVLIVNRGVDTKTQIMAFIYMWICAPSVLFSTFQAVILIPLLYFGFMLVKEMPKAVGSIMKPSNFDEGTPITSPQRSCYNCLFYNRADERCESVGCDHLGSHACGNFTLR